MKKSTRGIIATTLLIATTSGVGGLLLAFGAEKLDEHTNSQEFCTSCHAMKTYIEDTELFKTASHQTTSFGVRPKCSDCHIPKGLIAATYTHIVNGIGDLWGEFTLDYKDPKVWEAERPRLAYAVRDWLRANDSVTCRSCHTQDAIKPKKKRGQRMHKEAKETGMTCIDCHYNLIHEEVEARDSFLDSAGNQAK